MALGVCAEGLIRLFFVFIAFGIQNIGWGIIILLLLWFLFWIFSKFGLGVVQTALVLLVIFFVFFFATAWFTGAPLCEFANEVSLLLV